MRDAVAYLLSTLALLALMLRGTFTAWEAGLLLLGYGAYLAVCLWTSRGRGGGTAPGLHHRGYLPVTPTQAVVHGQPLGVALPLGEQQAQANGLERGGSIASQLEGVVVASTVAGGGQGALPGAIPRAQVELVSRVGASQPQRKLSRTASPAANGAVGSRPPSPGPGRALDARAAAQHQWQQWQQLESGAVQENELAALVNGMQSSDALAPAAAAPGAADAPGASPRASTWRSRLRRVGRAGRLGRLLASASLGLEELLHTRGRSGPGLWLAVAMAPLTLLLHATMPALHGGAGRWLGVAHRCAVHRAAPHASSACLACGFPACLKALGVLCGCAWLPSSNRPRPPPPRPAAGAYTPWYALVLASCAPLFMLLSTGLYPHHLGTPAFLLAWLLAALALYMLLLTVPLGTASAGPALPGVAANSAVAAGSGASPLAASSPGSPFGSSARLARLSPGLASPAAGGSAGSRAWTRVRQACSWRARRPRRNALLAVLASIQCMLWMSLAADELVSLFQVGSPCCQALGWGQQASPSNQWDDPQSCSAASARPGSHDCPPRPPPLGGSVGHRPHR